ncbi:MAG: peptidylprolyl isomerase [Pseudomonadota bacterium]|nr:peptidylprolyl isomerase [Pseudomonadota bacterium]
MSKKILLAASVMALAAFSMPSFAADAAKTEAASPGGDPVIARVNGQELHRSDLVHQLARMGPQAQQIPIQALYPQLLQKMVATKLVSAQGYAQGLQNDKDVKAQVKEAESQIVAEAWVRKTIQPKITEAKIKEKYDELSAKFKPQDEVRARHILVPTQAEAEAVIKQIKDGADFAKVAEEKSKDPGSAKVGGDLGYFLHDGMVKPFADAAFAMKPGEVSDKPVQTEYGWHVIKVEDKRKSSPPPLSEVRDQIANKLGQDMTNELVQNLEKSAKVEKYNIDGTPMKTADTKGDTPKP